MSDDEYGDRIQHNAGTNKHHIDGGLKGYNTRQTAVNALRNFQKRTQQGIDDAAAFEKSLKK